MEQESQILAKLQIAAGCFGLDGYGQGLEIDSQLAKLSAIVLKTTSLKPITPKREPTFIKFKSGNYCNWVGLRNPGIAGLANTRQKTLFERLPNLWLSLYAQDNHQYLALLRQANRLPWLRGYEINLSCPNLDNHQASQFLPEPQRLAGVSSRPLRYKVSTSNGLAGLRAAAMSGVATIIVGNTLPYRGGGLSGPILKKRHLSLIRQAKNLYPQLEIIGCGGIQTQADINDYLAAGASQVQVGSYFRATGLLPS